MRIPRGIHPLLSAVLLSGLLGWTVSSCTEESSPALVPLPPVTALRHSAALAAGLQTAADTGSTARRRALAGGLLWITRFTDDDEKFAPIFSDLLVCLNELACAEDPLTRRAARKLIERSLWRGADLLDEIYGDSPEDRWDFLSFLWLLYKYEGPIEPYLEFYRRTFPHAFSSPDTAAFAAAVAARDYDRLGDYLIDALFPHILDERFPGHPFPLSPSPFEQFLDLADDLPYVHTLQSDRDLYRAQNYYATHVIFTAAYYGERRPPDLPAVGAAHAYLCREFSHIRTNVGDLDLLAEVTHCRIIMGEGKKKEVQEALHVMTTLQNADGSWGYRNDFDGDAYDAFHPTWTVLTALASVAQSE